MPEQNLIYPYSFQIEILGVTDGITPEYFCTIDGLKNWLNMEEYIPGGSTRPFYIPNYCQTEDLSLKRPLMEGKTKISTWCEEAISTLQFKLTQAHIVSLNRAGGIIAQWNIEDVYPKGITIMPLSLQSQPEDLQIGEVITIGYSKLVRTK